MFGSSPLSSSNHDRYIYLYPELKLATIEMFVPTFSRGYASLIGEEDLHHSHGASANDAATSCSSSFSINTAEHTLIETIGEPVSRPSGVHRYRITPFSLGAAVSAGLHWRDVVTFLATRCVNWEDMRGTSTCGGGGEGAQRHTPHDVLHTAVPSTSSSSKPTAHSTGCSITGTTGSTADDAFTLTSSDEDDTDDNAAAAAEAPPPTIIAKQRNAIPSVTLPTLPSSSSSLPPHPIAEFVQSCMERYGKTTISFAADGKSYVESADKRLLLSLVKDPIIGSQCVVDKATGCIRVTIHAQSTAAATTSSSGGDAPAAQAEGVAAEGADASASSATDGTVAAPTTTTTATHSAPAAVKTYRAQLIDTVACKVVSERCLKLGYPCFHDYDYRNDTTVPAIACDLKVGTQPRPYQVAAVEASAASGRCRSGVLVLPCGAGKTLVGVMLVAAVKRRTLIVCAGSVSVSQWKNQVLDFANLAPPTLLRNTTKAPTSAAADADAAGADGSVYKPVRTGAQRIGVITSKEKSPITADTDIVITTYNMLSVAKKQYDRLASQVRAARYAARRARGSANAGDDDDQNANDDLDSVTLDDIYAHHTTMAPATRAKLAMFQPFGLVVLDEVHVVPAEFFKDALSSLQTRATVGLTATFVREDHRIDSLYHLIGAKLYDVGWQALAKDGFLARVMCVEVNCPMTPEFGMEYGLKQQMLLAKRRGAHQGGASVKTEGGSSTIAIAPRSHDTTPLLVMLAAANPTKMRTVLQLVAAHRNDKVLLFCDHILLLKVYARLLNCPIVSGETSHKDRMMIFSDFQSIGGGGGGGTTNSCNIIAISRVGDVSVNLPSANVVIQVSSHGGSRRQEAQRLGRVLRPKDSVIFKGGRQKALAAAFPPPKQPQQQQHQRGGGGGAGASEPTTTDISWLTGVLDRGDGADANAYFYSLVTEYSVEVPYATRRSEFLVDQGYPFYAVLAPSAPQPPPQAFRAKLEQSGYAASTAAAVTGGRRGGASAFLSAAGGGAISIKGAMAPSSVPTVTIESLWSREWCVAFLARIVSGWELKFYTASTTLLNGGSAAAGGVAVGGAANAGDGAAVRGGLGVKREREGDDAGLNSRDDAVARSHAHFLVDVAPPSEAPPAGGAVKTEEGEVTADGQAAAAAASAGGGETTSVALSSLTGLVLADDVVYSEM